MDPPKTIMTLWSAMSFGFLTRTAASVKWNSDKLRIMVFADMIAILQVQKQKLVRCSINFVVDVILPGTVPLARLFRGPYVL